MRSQLLALRTRLHKVLRYGLVYPAELWRLQRLLRSLQRAPSDADATWLLQQCYRCLMAQAPSPAAEAFYLPLLQSGQISPTQLLFSFLMIPGSVERACFGRTGIESHHQARLKLVQQHLPPAQHILDLGGASPAAAEGALLAMGYPHHAQTLDIVDFPPEQRWFHPPTVPQSQELRSTQGTQIRFFYRSFTDLQDFAPASYDLIWSGQSIEHITRIEAETVMAQAWRLLKPGGWFCLDTPNRLLTRLLVRWGYVHPEHKWEYEPQELSQRLEAVGFKMERQLAISPLPLSLASGRFSRLELLASEGLDTRPEAGFSFFLAARKAL